MIAAAAVCLCLLTVAPKAVSQPAPAPSPSIDISATLHSTSKTPLPRIVRINQVYQPPQHYQAFKRWSNTSTWKGHPRPPQAGDNVQIFCGESILLDVPDVKLGLLEIYGHLAFLDDASLPNISLSADSVFVFGNLSIGSADKPFSQHATVNLTGNQLYEYVEPYTDVGFKTLAVIGGQLNLHGMPGGNSTPAWVQLTQTAPANATSITLDQDVMGWPVGSKIAIATTDFDPEQTETVEITAVNRSTLTFRPKLKYSHFAPGVPTGIEGVTMPMAAEVGLINRNILVTSTQEAPSNQLQGGHVIIYETKAQQSIVGVEFSYLGQQGTLGRYPLHFHLCGSVPDNVVRKNSVHNSLQRCYNVHATHNMTLEDNFAFNTTGHCFILEDGIEMGNTFLHNLGLVNKPPQVLIPAQQVAETDNENTIFWSATPLNRWINNTAAGSSDTGFWLQLKKVNGVSASIKGASKLNLLTSPLTEFVNNTAHSNTVKGLRTYKNGFHPKVGGEVIFQNMVVYKTQGFGIFCHGCLNVTVAHAMVADTQYGVEFSRVGNNTLRDSIIIALSDNLGNPVHCKSQACQPAAFGTCPTSFNSSSIGNNPGAGFRTVPDAFKKKRAYGYGVILSGNNAENNTFVNFNTTCHKAAALGQDNFGLYPITTLARQSRSTFVNVAKDQRWWVDPTLGPQTDNWYVAEDVDGSLTGNNGSAYVVVANNSQLLPPASQNSKACSLQPGWNAYTCRGLCFRSVTVNYEEPSASGSNLLSPFQPDLVGSYLVTTRTADSANLTVHGFNEAGAANGTGAGLVTFYPNGTFLWRREFGINLLSGYSYNVTIMNTANGVTPSPITWMYSDTAEEPLNPPCNGTVDVAFSEGVTPLPAVTTAG